MISMEYIINQIKDLCIKVTDGSHFSPVDDLNGEFQMYSVKDMEYNGFNDDNCKHIGKDMFDKLSKSDCRPLKNDILIAKDGSYLKYVFKCNETLNSCILSSIAILRPNIKKIDPDYFVYLLRTQSIKDAMASYVSGSALPRIILSDFKKMKIKMIEDKNIQTHIATILNNFDQLIENNNKRIKLLEEMAGSLYKEWFVRFRFPNHEKVKFENGLPNGWKIKELKEFGISLTSGSRPKGGIDDTLRDGIPSFGAEVIGDLGTFDFSNVKYIPHEYYQKMKRGRSTKYDILIYKDGAYIGKTTMFRDGYPFDKYCINEHVFFIEPNDIEYKNYLYFTLHQKEMFGLMQVLNRNAAQPGLSQDDVARIKIKIPSKSIIVKFNEIIDGILSLIFKYAKENLFLSKQRDALLPRLMSGKLSVEGKEVI